MDFDEMQESTLAIHSAWIVSFFSHKSTFSSPLCYFQNTILEMIKSSQDFAAGGGM